MPPALYVAGPMRGDAGSPGLLDGDIELKSVENPGAEYLPGLG